MPSSSTSQKKPAAVTGHCTVEEIDSLFETAGLVRSLRGKPAGVPRRARMKQVAPEELSGPVPVPTVAPNGVQLLKIPAWEKPEAWLPGFGTASAPARAG